jgi:ParB family transcriptional regulator, chromosome partitioning protein
MAAPARPVSRLGRGLKSLMAQPVSVTPTPGAKTIEVTMAPQQAGQGGQAAASLENTLVYLPVADIKPNRHQPRQDFDPEALRTLAASIKAEGLIQPIVVRKGAEGGFELVAGERRWRAAKLAGLTTIPGIVRALDDRQIAEWALIENLQREDLNPIERAEAFQRLLATFGLGHDQIADRVGIDRSSVSNALRLLALDPEVRDYVRKGLLSGSQAKAIAALTGVSEQRSLAQKTIKQQLSVRQVESAVRMLSKPVVVEATDKPAKLVRAKALHLADLEDQVARQLGTKVAIKQGRKKGTGALTIEFYSIDQFDQLMHRLGIATES